MRLSDVQSIKAAPCLRCTLTPDKLRRYNTMRTVLSLTFMLILVNAFPGQQVSTKNILKKLLKIVLKNMYLFCKMPPDQYLGWWWCWWENSGNWTILGLLRTLFQVNMYIHHHSRAYFHTITSDTLERETWRGKIMSTTMELIRKIYSKNFQQHNSLFTKHNQ